MSHVGHEIIRCSNCSAVISQCRCAEPNKQVKYVVGCPKCTPSQPPVQPVGDVAEPPLRVRGGTLQNFKDACTAPISQESAKKMVQLAIAERDAQWEKALQVQYDQSAAHFNIAAYIASVRARLAQADKPRTPAERIFIRQFSDGNYAYTIEVDGTSVAYVIRSPYGVDADKKTADAVAAGLRAELEGGK
jgi:hypothetical protein